MSDFATLLKKLERTADAACNDERKTKRKQIEQQSKKTIEENDNDRRSLKKHQIGGKSFSRQYSVNDSRKGADISGSSSPVPYRSFPSDLNQLRLKISFFGIGAQKAGTSWLHFLLSQHPDLTLPRQKEVHFWDWNRTKGLGWYTKQFIDDVSCKNRDKKMCKNDMLYGEITPCYAALNEKDIIEIRTLFPDAKLVFIARDIVERTWSALLMELRNSVKGIDAGNFATLSVHDDALERFYDEEADPDKYDDDYFMERIRHSTHSRRSNYAACLKMWLKHFPKEQLLILNFREISENPRIILAQVCDFLGLETDKYISSLRNDVVGTRINPARGSISHRNIRPSLRRKMELYLRDMTREFNDILYDLAYTWKLEDGQVGVSRC
mmetsp:Transcript_37362/g.43492  ORF Transcript_37362/g.43492 Transcript_37362/m.43492 type:complete len:382 (-) Transcript_37362:654-1799(-)